MTDAEQLWGLCAEALQHMVSEAAWRMWFTSIVPSWVDEQRLVLDVPSMLAKERLQSGHLPLITDVVGEMAGAPMTVEFVVRTPAPASDVADDDQPDEFLLVPLTPAGPNGSAGDLDGTEPVAPASQRRGGLRPNFTFDAFVIADSNRFARAAAGVVAETPGLAYNPLVIYGGSGLGKTHLLHAIGNYVRTHFPNYTVQYTPTEACMNEFVEALRTRTTLAFKRRYRECDVLLMDDFQFIMTSDRLGEEFFYTFNELQEASKQIVIVSDRSPNEMGSLDERFRSRLLSGLVTDVKPPDLETRIAILRKKAERHPLEAVPDDVLVLIATHIRDNIRELEGALTQVVAFARHNDEPLTRQLAEKVLSEALSKTRPRPVTPDLVIETASELWGFTVADLKGPNRSRPLVQARQIAMYVLRQLTDHSYPAIAGAFGGRDHTTVIHAVKKVEGLMPERAKVYQEVQQLTRRLTTGE
ncbi:MAG TPA: chromosomal replication initiator protein DnaA [Acidimicrobiales bacterium]|nr:chromosomal replication initiator protein DnaA [Acidimicrobiales bacterium]